MLKFIFILIFISFGELFSQSQWVIQNPSPIGSSMQCVKTIGASTVYEAGYFGIVMKSTDAGITWNSLQSGTTNSLEAISFPDINNGFIVGKGGIILHTTNAGASFDLQNSNTLVNLRSVYFVNSNWGTAVGDYGTIVHTTNGGNNWLFQNSDTISNIYSVNFLNMNTGIIAGGNNGVCFMKITSNGGLSWLNRTTNFYGGNYYFVAFIDSSTVIAVANQPGRIFRSTNKGSTWINTYYGGGKTPPQLWTASFKDAYTGTAIGTYQLNTTDGGQNWSYGSSNMNFPTAISLSNSNFGFVSGIYGYNYRTTDGGMNWENIRHSIADDCFRILFLDSLNGYFIGLNGKILHTLNGGIQWEAQQSGVIAGLSQANFLNLNTGYIVGSNSNSSLGVIIKTTNTGKSWQNIFNIPNIQFNGVSFINPNTGMAVGNYGYITKTTNGGQSWTDITFNSTYYLYKVDFIDENIAFAVGSKPDNSPGLVLRTTNGGTNWISLPNGSTGRLYDVDFINTNTGTIVGDYGTILRTTNQGLNWTVQSGDIHGFTKVQFLNANTGIVLGNWAEDLILKTTNAGLNWIRQSGPTNQSIYDGCFIGSDFIVTGYAGLILRNRSNSLVNVGGTVSNIPDYFRLKQNYPNPFNPTTQIKYELPITNFVILKVYDVLGNEVETLVNENQNAGSYSVTFNASNYPSGIYFYKIETSNFSETKKMLLIK
ncbi:hypothetical protein BH10BAC5_BH10BAC5_02370 [soil metagenome]